MKLTDEDYKAIADKVIAKLRDGTEIFEQGPAPGKKHERRFSDDEFIKKLVDEMIKHRSPCHELDDRDIDSLKDVIKHYRKIGKGVAFISWSIILYMLKSLYDILIANIHWGNN